jgi:hypothetical protein
VKEIATVIEQYRRESTKRNRSRSAELPAVKEILRTGEQRGAGHSGPMEVSKCH